ncbi:GTP-binding protein [Thiomicrorhabdus sp. Kp2]|uniref:CobW family GTP-binding protein n=1 Tax=Thiomicrorhabdus sp. Kp2 TaxID=1123518 RepID=UPI0004282D4C|nr:GTP-binding protein [Thiomicrorhabdus sp. Kp2]
MSQTLPVHLITGLLGSGKTTCLKHLIQQKPCNENWAILINEFGEVDIDASQLQSNHNTHSLNIQTVSGGCICCTAQIGLVNTINQLLSDHTLNFDRIWIEPTGLGHPAKIIDAIQHTQFLRPLALQKIVCVVTPQQLTAERWKKSAVMRDLVNLADTIILNKSDLSDADATTKSLAILDNCYPSKNQIIPSQYSNVSLQALLGERPFKPFTLLSQKTENDDSEHQQQTENPQAPYHSIIDKTQACYISQTSDPKQPLLLSMGWIWDSTLQFNRVKIKAFFEEISPYLIRAKGLIKTGNEWQLVNWSEGELKFEDIAWRQDSRLECLFKSNRSNRNDLKLSPQQLEKQIKNTINNLMD